MAVFRFSANTGFLWKELPFLDRIRKAAKYGFDAVEFHDEAQSEDRNALKETLAATGLPVVGLNVRMGDTAGCAALPDMVCQAKRDIDAAIDVAEDIGATAVHVLSGKTETLERSDAYLDSLRFALDNTRLIILIEPICREQVPGYFLSTIEQAAGILAEIGNPRLKILFDCYHVHQEGGSVLERFCNYAGLIGHVQIASSQERSEPFPSQLDYRFLLPRFQSAGYHGPFGCEYRPQGCTEDGLAWREMFTPKSQDKT